VELVEEDEEPALAGQRRSRVARGEAGAGVAEGGPGADEPAPGAGDLLRQALVRAQVVARRVEAGKLAVAGGEALEEVGREEGALAAHGGEGLPAAGAHQAAGRRT